MWGGFPLPLSWLGVSVPQIQHPPCWVTLRAVLPPRLAPAIPWEWSLAVASSVWLVSKTPMILKPFQPILAVLSSMDTTEPIPEAVCRSPSVCSSTALFPEGNHRGLRTCRFAQGWGRKGVGRSQAHGSYSFPPSGC